MTQCQKSWHIDWVRVLAVGLLTSDEWVGFLSCNFSIAIPVSSEVWSSWGIRAPTKPGKRFMCKAFLVECFECSIDKSTINSIQRTLQHEGTYWFTFLPSVGTVTMCQTISKVISFRSSYCSKQGCNLCRCYSLRSWKPWSMVTCEIMVLFFHYGELQVSTFWSLPCVYQVSLQVCKVK